MTRIHGDFHLGQVLVASGDAYIIDFEGEPARPLAERRAKTSPLRDVAGPAALVRLCRRGRRSIRRRRPRRRVRRGTRAERSLTRLRDGAQQAFLDGLSRGSRRACRASATTASLLDFFLLEKAAYEIGYEAANRPAWLAIPLHGLLAPRRAASAAAARR